MAYEVTPGKLIFRTQDQSAQVATTSFFVPAGTAIDAVAVTDLRDAMHALQVGRIAGYSIGAKAEEDGSILPLGGPYENVEDKFFFEFVDAAGNTSSCSIPAPQQIGLKADNEEIDWTNPTVAVFIVKVLALCLSAAGRALVALKKAYRKRSKLRAS